MDLEWSLEDTVTRFPRPEGTLAADRDDRGAQLFGLLTDLRDHGAFRINCGGNRLENRGRTWERDRFFLGGDRFYLFKLDPSRSGDDDYGVYRNERYFWEGGELLPGYAFPVPPGRYHVVLHTVEGWFEEAGRRIFDVLIEGEPCLESHDPYLQGFGEPQSTGCTVEVEDGLLEIDLRRRVENPKLSAIEIIRL